MSKKQRIGLMGGTFNPIHLGHLILAEQAKDQYHLDLVYFMPAFLPPHKQNQEILSGEDREQMILCAIQGNPSFCCTDFELKQGKVCYTVDTLKEWKKAFPNQELFFLIGADSLYQMESWKDPQNIFSQCTILAAGRESKLYPDLQKQADYLEEKYQGKVDLIRMPEMDISSQWIRQARKNGNSIEYLVPREVEEYIRRKKLYLS